MHPNWLIALPLDHPVEFGRALRSLSEEVLTPGDHRQAVYTLVDALSNAGFKVNYSTVAGWLRGDLNQHRGRFTPDHFRVLVKDIFWGHPSGLNSADEIIALARCAGTYKHKGLEIPYASLLDSDWFHELVSKQPVAHPTPPPADMRYPLFDFHIPRKRVQSDIADRIALAQTLRSPLVILGQSGTGKTILVRQLSNDKTLISRFPDGLLVAHLSGQPSDIHLRIWYERFFGRIPFGSRKEEQIDRIQRFMRGKRYLILIDDVSDPAYARALMVSDPGYGLTIITTHDDAIAQTLAANDRLLLRLGGFTIDEVHEFYQKVWGALPDDMLQPLERLCQALLGNPLALHFGLHAVQRDGFERVLSLLQSQDANVPAGVLPEVFMAMRIDYERLSPFLRSRFDRLGALPELYGLSWYTLAALWEDDWRQIRSTKDKTEDILSKLQDQTGIFIPIQGDLWQLHQQVHLFAKSKLMVAPAEEQLTAHGWLQRADRQGLHSQKLSGWGKVTRTTWLSPLQDRQLPAAFRPQDSLPRRLWKLLFNPDYSTSWSIVQANTAAFTAEEYVLAYWLARRNQRLNWLVFAVLLIVLFGIVFNVGLGIPAPARQVMVAGLCVTSIVTTVCYAILGAQGIAMWSVLRHKAFQRYQDPSKQK